MLPKFAWVVGPLVIYGAVCAILALRGRAPSRMALNVHLSLLLLAYLLGTAGLGIFWVANQQLPVFDWHYLFGYVTLLLVGLHLVFNLPVVVRWLGRRRGAAQAPSSRSGNWRMAGKVAGLFAMLGLAFYIGQRQGDAQLALGQMPEGEQHPVARYHTFSSSSRASVFQRAPGVSWGDAPPVFKRYAAVPTVALSRGAPGTRSLGELLAAPAPAGSLTLPALGRMLHLTAGITLQRGGRALRAAPSSGALFPSELYIAARRVTGLAPGLYHYDPEHHRLDLLGPVPATLGSAAAQDAEAVLLLTSIFRRTGYKYHNRAYRYALADAGHLLENMRLAAHGAGLHARLLPQFDDAQAARALGVDGVEEGVLAMMPLHLQDRPPPCESPCPDAELYEPVTPARDTAIGVTGVVHQATSLRLPAAIKPDIALPPPQNAAAEIYATIVKRRSERRYADAPLTMAQLSGLLADMRQRPQLFDGIRATVVINRVSGVAPGVYRYLPSHGLRLVKAGDHAGAAQSAALAQDAIGDAAAVLILSAERDRVLAGGARGYRHALIETGMLGERWLLGAVARALAACPVGAFYDDEAAALIGEDPNRHWVFHFAAVGVPAR